MFFYMPHKVKIPLPVMHYVHHKTKTEGIQVPSA